MARDITSGEFCDDSAAVLRAVEAGESLVVTRDGVPIAELVPLPRRQFVAVQQVLDAFRDAPTIDAESFFADLDAISEPGLPPRR